MRLRDLVPSRNYTANKQSLSRIYTLNLLRSLPFPPSIKILLTNSPIIPLTDPEHIHTYSLTHFKLSHARNPFKYTSTVGIYTCVHVSITCISVHTPLLSSTPSLKCKFLKDHGHVFHIFCLLLEIMPNQKVKVVDGANVDWWHHKRDNSFLKTDRTPGF